MAGPKLKADHLQKRNKRSLYSLCPKSLHPAMNAVPRALFLEDEISLEKEVRPTPTMRLLRFKFWDQYMKVQHNDTITKMDLGEVCDGVCNPEFFAEKVMSTHYTTAWLLTPPKSYEDSMEEALRLGVTRLRELLSLPLYKEVRKLNKETQQMETIRELDHRVANIILKAYYMVDQRAKGGFIQRSQNVTAIMGASANPPPRDVFEKMSMEEIESRIKELEASNTDHSAELPIQIESKSKKVANNVDNF